MALKGGSGENNIGSKVFFLFFGRGVGGGSLMKSFKFCKDDICYDANSLPECKRF